MTFSLAFAIGFSVASIPGPTIILIATETLRKGAIAGLQTMLAPLLIDALLMVPLGLLIHASLFSGRGVVALGVAGGCFLAWLGLQSIRAGLTRTHLESDREPASVGEKIDLPPFLKGTVTHLTSPFPYLYWGTVGSSFIRQGLEERGAWGAVVFPSGFWLGASAFTLMVIYLMARGKNLLPARWEPYLHYLSGLLLIGSGIFLAVKVWQGRF